MEQINEKNLTSFFGSVPQTVELSFLGLCLAPVDFKTMPMAGGLNFVGSKIEHDGYQQPIIVTLGNENSVAPNMRQAIYKSLHLTNILENVGNPYEQIAEKFSRMASKMGKNNDYAGIIETRYKKYRDLVKNVYPEELSALDAAKESYVNALKAVFEQEQSKGENDSKKKTIAPAQAAM